ncbi:DUF721 domain-containing protein [Brevirhabdus sp.]|uniref:DUF721 domain-containing protein n=1 Tax=Brevirhabdus sp. TaxID=2004514 RepID=UPI00405944AC
MAYKTGSYAGQNRGRRSRGFLQAAGLIQGQVRCAGETRGFAVSRLITHWEEIVGVQIAAMTRPVKVSYARQGFGATLTVLTNGASAPMVEMQKEQIREKVNGCYGYAAISRIKLTQTAPVGFSEGQAEFRSKAPSPPDPDPQIAAAAEQAASAVGNDELRRALEALGRNVMARRKR